MKISESSIVIQRNGSELDSAVNFKDGQKVLAKIVSVSDEEAVIQVAGNIIRAKVEGPRPTPGSVCLFEVHLGEKGRIELKTLANLDDNGAGNPQIRIDHLLADALREEGVSVSPENLQMLRHLISTIQMRYNNIPDLKVAAFLIANKLPLSSGTLLMAWLKQDHNLRDYLWNLLERAGLIDPDTKLNLNNEPQEILNTLFKLKTKADEDLKINNYLNILKGLQSALEGGREKNEETWLELRKVIGRLLENIRKNVTGWSGNESEAETRRIIDQLLETLRKGSTPEQTGETGMALRKALDQLIATLEKKVLGEPEGEAAKQSKIADQLLETLEKGVAEEHPNEVEARRMGILFSQAFRTNGTGEPDNDIGADLKKILTQLFEGLKQNTSGEQKVTVANGRKKLMELLNSLGETVGKSTPEAGTGLWKIAELLTHPMVWNRIDHQNNEENLRYGVVPFLVQNGEGSVRECVISWEETKEGAEGQSRGQIVRVLIPTENLGDIRLEINLTANFTSIRFDVESEAVKRYLLKQESRLKEITGSGVLIRVEAAATPGESSFKGVDLWI